MANIGEKIKLLKGLLGDQIAHTGPFYVTIDVTRRCNLNCTGCRYHSPELNMPSPGEQNNMDISLDMVKKLCDELEEMGTTRNIIFTGEGEPLIHPHIFDMIEVAKHKGFHISLFTNGTFLEESMINSLIDSRLDRLQVALWASTPKVYEQNYPGANPENFRKIINGLKRLARLKVEKRSNSPAVVLHHPINRINYRNIDAMFDLAHDTGCSSISFSPLKSRRGKLASYALSSEEEKCLRNALTLLKESLNSLSLKHNIDQTLLRYEIGEEVWGALPCYIGWLHARIKVNGVVLPCNPCDLPMGNLQEKKFSEIWNDLPYRSFRSNTRTREGLGLMDSHCDCGFCCHVEDNLRVHRLFRWFAPLKNSLNVHHWSY